MEVNGQLQPPAALPPRNNPSLHCIKNNLNSKPTEMLPDCNSAFSTLSVPVIKYFVNYRRDARKVAFGFHVTFQLFLSDFSPNRKVSINYSKILEQQYFVQILSAVSELLHRDKEQTWTYRNGSETTCIFCDFSLRTHRSTA
jgi:hypothetical protein